MEEVESLVEDIWGVCFSIPGVQLARRDDLIEKKEEEGAVAVLEEVVLFLVGEEVVVVVVANKAIVVVEEEERIVDFEVVEALRLSFRPTQRFLPKATVCSNVPDTV